MSGYASVPGSERFRPNVLIKLQEGVELIMGTEAKFKKLEQIHAALGQRAIDLVEAASFLESMDPDAGQDDLERMIAKRAKNHDLQVASLGYISRLLAGRNQTIEQQAAAWSAMPDVQAFLGEEIVLVPRGHWHPDDTIASISCDRSAVDLKGKNRISGRITGISALHRGTIYLENGIYVVHDYSLGGGNEPAHVYSEGRVKNIFVPLGPALITPSASIVP